MKLLVFGATGGTGRQVVSQALAKGLSVVAFARRPERLAPQSGLSVIRGDVADPAAVGEAVAGCDAVISTLGVGTPFKPDPAVRAGIEHIVAAMERSATRRLVYLSFIGVTASRAMAGPVLRFVARYPLRHEIADHEIKERRIQASALDWTIVRAPNLTNGPPSGAYRSGEAIRAGFFPRLSRADVAAFLIDEATNGRFLRKAVSLLPAT